VEALRKLALFASILENDAVTARPARIFEARAITEYFYGFELGIELDYGVLKLVRDCWWVWYLALDFVRQPVCCRAGVLVVILAPESRAATIFFPSRVCARACKY
jgi:hypothetical protein